MIQPIFFTLHLRGLLDFEQFKIQPNNLDKIKSKKQMGLE